MLQLHLSYQQFNCLLRCDLHKRFYGNDNLVWVTFCFCTGSYATAGCSLVHAITSEQLFRFLSFLVGLMDLTYRLPDKISVNFCRDLTLNFQGQIWNFAVSRPKMVRLPRNKSKHIDWTLSLKRDHRIWPWPWPWPCIFKVKYGIHYISAKNGPIAIKQTKKHIDWTLSLKCDHWIWPWPWPWPWIFKVKYGICYILSKNGPITTKQKANISIELYASNVTIGFDPCRDLEYEFSRSNFLYVLIATKWKYAYRMNWRPQWPSSLTLAMTLEGEV